MREILFRSKGKHNKNWVYGSFIPLLSKDTKQDVCGIKDDTIYRQVHLCELETVGQYTGLTDKNGTKIFEHDIVKCTDKTNGYDFTAVVLFGNPNAQYNWGFQLKQISGEKANTDILLWVEMEEGGAFIEIIGNIHDNPELLKGE